MKCGDPGKVLLEEELGESGPPSSILGETKMNEQKVHKMNCAELSDKGPNGWHEFICLECSRHIKIRFEPFKCITISEGDTFAQHTGSIGPVAIGAFQVQQTDSTEGQEG